MRRVTSFLVLLIFFSYTIGPLPQAEADQFRLPAPGVMVHLSPPFDPPILKGIKVYPDNPFRFDFILDKGDGLLPQRQNPDALKQESTKLIKYFLASLTIPEKDRIIPQSFGLTEMGRDLLAEDYMLKQITASLIYPEDMTGKKFWKRIYEEAAKKFGTTNIPVDTFNKVWIVPEKAVVYENVKKGTAYVVEARLKIMLEEDYLALSMNTPARGHVLNNPMHNVASQVIRATLASEKLSQESQSSLLAKNILQEIVIPELSREVNEDRNFAQLRQVYNSLVLATWYKKKIKDSILSQVYSDRNKVAGVGYDQSMGPLPSNKVLATQRDAPNDVEIIYHHYLQAFKKGVYNYIKEDVDPASQETVPRKYFSGGVDWAMFGDEADKTLHLIGDEIMVPSPTKSAFVIKVDMAMYKSKGLGFMMTKEKLKEQLVFFTHQFTPKRITASRNIWDMINSGSVRDISDIGQGLLESLRDSSQEALNKARHEDIPRPPEYRRFDENLARRNARFATLFTLKGAFAESPKIMIDQNFVDTIKVEKESWLRMRSKISDKGDIFRITKEEREFLKSKGLGKELSEFPEELKQMPVLSILRLSRIAVKEGFIEDLDWISDASIMLCQLEKGDEVLHHILLYEEGDQLYGVHPYRGMSVKDKGMMAEHLQQELIKILTDVNFQSTVPFEKYEDSFGVDQFSQEAIGYDDTVRQLAYVIFTNLESGKPLLVERFEEIISELKEMDHPFASVLPTFDDWLAFSVMGNTDNYLDQVEKLVKANRPWACALLFAANGPHTRAVFVATDLDDVEAQYYLINGFIAEFISKLQEFKSMKAQGDITGIKIDKVMLRGYAGALANGLMLRTNLSFSDFFDQIASHIEDKSINLKEVLSEASEFFPEKMPSFLHFVGKDFGNDEINRLAMWAREHGMVITAGDLFMGIPSQGADEYRRQMESLYRSYVWKFSHLPYMLHPEEKEQTEAKYAELQRLIFDKAMTGIQKNGGIDLTSAHMNLQTEIDSRDNAGIQFHLDPAMLAQFQGAPGFVPVIISIKPLKSLHGFLELSDA